MRKLPSDHDVAMLRSCGWKVKDICDRYGVSRLPVYEALKRWKGQQSRHSETSSLHKDRRFIAAGAQAVDHRDTGEGIGFGRAFPTGKVYHTTLNDCRDLLREWGVK